MTERLLQVGLVVLLSGQTLCRAAILHVDARKLFEDSVTRSLALSENSAEIQLESGELFEDDGPASGHSYLQPDNREQLTRETWIKKELLIPNPAARAAYLVILSEEPVEIVLNGKPLQLGPNLSGRKSHKAFAFPPELLRTDRNEVILRNSGKVWIARDDEFALGSRTRTKHPNRSAKSIDGGKTWDYEHLGPDGKLDGEYGVRIFLDHYRSGGSLTMPVLDVGNLEGKTIPELVAETGPIKVGLVGEPGPAGHISIRARTGTTYVPRQKSWSDWQILGETGGILRSPRGRYLQIAVDLGSDDPLRSPKVRGLTVEAAPHDSTAWTARVRVLDEHNEQIVRTAMPFEYEPLDHPSLKKLREQYKLDEVTRGATNELDLMLRLAQWVCNYWDWPNHITEQYPPWNALEILNSYRDGNPTGGFCLQFNLVFLQACESYGFNGRMTSISQGRCQEQHPGGGHEIVELWSNEWKKWIYVDGALAWYILDEKTGTPLSIWELRQHQLPTLHGKPVEPVRVIEAKRTRNKQFTWNGLAAPEPLNWYFELRMIPRSNFLQEKAPVPLNQGTDEWSWTGHYVWSDTEVPAGFLFGNRVSKHSDFEWTLNQAHYVLEPTGQPGSLRVHLDTETPSFEIFLAEIDGGEKKPVGSDFTWTLHPGKNELRVVPRNVVGREGISSWITMEYSLE
ncbi:MAG TPA: transglutaminase domain-containing protein [Verrucomicrobiae bacterium]|nr:transglutaminase domain-containing protein [Verrucomicrobiae bacterium]